MSLLTKILWNCLTTKLRWGINFRFLRPSWISSIAMADWGWIFFAISTKTRSHFCKINSFCSTLSFLLALLLDFCMFLVKQQQFCLLTNQSNHCVCKVLLFDLYNKIFQCIWKIWCIDWILLKILIGHNLNQSYFYINLFFQNH